MIITIISFMEGIVMKIRILGSGGGEGFPAPFCSCEHCEDARKKGGKSLRTLSQSIIDNTLLIDLPSDTNAHCLRFKINLGQIQNILITHSHPDHYVPDLLATRGDLYAHNMKYKNLYIYGPSDLKALFNRANISKTIRENIHFIDLKAGEKVKIGEYDVTPIDALHAPTLGSLNYIIEKDGKSLLYLIDSGYPTEATLEFLKGMNKVFNAVVMDGTMGTSEPLTYLYHMGYEENKQLKQELIQKGIADTCTRFVVTHITHNKSEYHEKVEEIFKGTGISVAYDGFETEI